MRQSSTVSVDAGTRWRYHSQHSRRENPELSVISLNGNDRMRTVDVDPATSLIDEPDGEAAGAGKTSIALTTAAIGHAIFDATGARVRQVPFTPERVKAALDAGRAG